MKHPVKLLLALLLGVLVLRGAYAQGVKHAITSACPYVEGTSIMIDFDGQVHEYR